MPHVRHVALKVVAQGDAAQVDAVVVVALLVAAPKEVGHADPAESRREKRQVQELSRIHDRVGQSEK